MACKVHQDVDPVLSHRLGHLLIAEPNDCPPLICVAAQLLGHVIAMADVRVAENPKSCVIMMLQYRQQKATHRMLSEIRR